MDSKGRGQRPKDKQGNHPESGGQSRYATRRSDFPAVDDGQRQGEKLSRESVSCQDYINDRSGPEEGYDISCRHNEEDENLNQPAKLRVLEFEPRL
jgi:hypothetical protein